MAFALGIPGIDIGGTGFQFQRCGDPITGLEFVIAGFLAVFMEIDETWSDDEAIGIDGIFALNRVYGDDRDLARLDADVADRVEAGFGVEDASANNDEVVRFLADGMRSEK